MPEQFDTIIIGDGQGGLAAGYFPARLRRDLAILDGHARSGDSWRRARQPGSRPPPQTAAASDWRRNGK